MEESNQIKKQLELLAQNVNEAIYNQRKHLLGRVLTVMDATTTDPQQRKATKALMEEIFYQGSYWNDIRWHFQQIAKAHGFEILPDSPLTMVQDPKNIYEQV